MLTERPRQWLLLASVMASVALLWLVILPWLGRQKQLAEHIQLQQNQQIDPSAMFYSELEIVPAIAHRVERLHESYGYTYRREDQVMEGRSGE